VQHNSLPISASKVDILALAPQIFLYQVADGRLMTPPMTPPSDPSVPPIRPWSRSHRLFPLEHSLGAYLPVDRFSDAIIATGYTGTWSIEVFNDSLAEKGEEVPREHARRAIRGLSQAVKEAYERAGKQCAPFHPLFSCPDLPHLAVSRTDSLSSASLLAFSRLPSVLDSSRALAGLSSPLRIAVHVVSHLKSSAVLCTLCCLHRELASRVLLPPPALRTSDERNEFAITRGDEDTDYGIGGKERRKGGAKCIAKRRKANRERVYGRHNNGERRG
jgi:hypothetical protein